MTASFRKLLNAFSAKALVLLTCCASPVFATTTSDPIPAGSAISCQEATTKTRAWLVEKKAFIPFTTNTRAGRIQPRVAIENGNYAETYRSFPSSRPEKIVFYLSGDANQIGKEHWGPPRLLHPLLQ